MPIYLYVKTHNKTGLKYLGKTISKDPIKYKGSGLYWRNHITKHGYDVTTEIIKECRDDNELKSGDNIIAIYGILSKVKNGPI